MNILHVIARFHLGGSEKIASQLCIGHAGLKHSCSVVAITTPIFADPVGQEMKSKLSSAGVAIHEFAGVDYRKASLTTPFMLARLFAAIDPDIVHSHTDRPDFVVSLAARLRPTPLARTIHNTSLWETHFLAGLVAESGFKDDLVVSLSEPCRQAYKANRRRFHLKESRFQHLIRNGVALPAVSVAGQEKLRYLGADLQRTQLCFAGRLTRQKGLDVLISALLLLPHEALERLEVHAFGVGEDKAKLMQIVDAKRLPVRFHEPVPNVSEFFPAFDAVLIPSRFEGQPLVALESLVAGVPIIATSAPGLGEALPDEWPLVAAPGDPKAFADKVALLLQAPVRYKKLATSNAHWAREKYSAERMIREYELAYLSYTASRSTDRGHARPGRDT